MTTTQLFNFGSASTPNPADIFYYGQSGIEKALTLAALSAYLASINPMLNTGYTATTANFTQPASAANVSVNVGTTAWMVVGQTLYVAGGGFYTVYQIVSGTNVILTNTGTTGNLAPGNTVTSGAGIVFGGLQGIQGPTGATGATGAAGPPAWTTTTASYTQPASGSNVTVSVVSTAWMVVGQNVYVGAGGYYTVYSINSGTSVTLTNSGTSGNASPTSTVPTSQSVNGAGSAGSSGLPSVTGNAGLPLTNNGSTAQWGITAFDAMAILNFINS